MQRERGETADGCLCVTLRYHTAAVPSHSSKQPQPPPLPGRGRLSFLLSPTRLSHGLFWGVFLLLLLCFAFASALPSFDRPGGGGCTVSRHATRSARTACRLPHPPLAITTLVPAASLASEQTSRVARSSQNASASHAAWRPMAHDTNGSPVFVDDDAGFVRIWQRQERASQHLVDAPTVLTERSSAN